MPVGYRWVRDDCGRGWSIISGRRATFIALAFFLAKGRVGSSAQVDDEHGGTDIKVPGTPAEGRDQQPRKRHFNHIKTALESFENPRASPLLHESALKYFENPRASPLLPEPAQVKVRVALGSGRYLALIVAFNITYQSLVGQIDANLARYTDTSSRIRNGLLKLRYRDKDGDLVVIEDDEDIEIAFTEWHEAFLPAYPGSKKGKKKATVLALGYDAMMYWKCVLYYS
ncbi:hypothetical protein CEP54_006784 [Fusarium duplospermum]|uniref:PB1 domain-containing protein n=1 Tax=Fusarium duplospermum TaxID=1325734 RepID=A0A428Q5B3_9HYPO|nr:hypothetical protein CEP54_006784 [Fusarium duplospermum]